MILYSTYTDTYSRDNGYGPLRMAVERLIEAAGDDTEANNIRMVGVLTMLKAATLRQERRVAV